MCGSEFPDSNPDDKDPRHPSGDPYYSSYGCACTPDYSGHDVVYSGAPQFDHKFEELSALPNVTVDFDCTGRPGFTEYGVFHEG